MTPRSAVIVACLLPARSAELMPPSKAHPPNTAPGIHEPHMHLMRRGQPLWSLETVRSIFIEFFEARAHTFWPSSPVVPINDPTLLFANAGMNQYKAIFLGKADPSSQVRAWATDGTGHGCHRLTHPICGSPCRLSQQGTRACSCRGPSTRRRTKLQSIACVV